MSKALPIIIAVILGAAGLVPVLYASKNPESFLTHSKNSIFDPKSASSVEKISYALGYEVATQTPPELDVNAFTSGIRAAYSNQAFPMSEQEINDAYQEFVAQQQAKVSTTNQPSSATSQINAVDENFLKENAKKPGVHTTISGLQYTINKMGHGRTPSASDTVKVNYEGKFINNQIFDSSFERKEPISFALNQVIPGWTEGLQLMQEGAEYTFFIPANLAYGSAGKGSIPPNSTLIFKVELIAVQ